MTTTTAPAPSPTPGHRDATPPVSARRITTASYHRPPGTRAPRFLWAFMAISWLGMALDTLLGMPVISQLFPEATEAMVYALMLALGLACAALATKVGVDLAYGHTAKALLLLVFVLGIGVALAYARLTLGFTAEGAGEGFGATVDETNDEVPATVLMLVLYVGSTLGALFTAQKVFIAERRTLREAKAELDAQHAAQAQDQAEYATIHERIAARPRLSKDMDELHAKALEQADARESYLKAYARDAIARAVGRPDATPLVRAPQVSSED
ncbi:MAG TPA: hypothetical protein PKE40_09480 [Arachnia sp.]|nr:hypothetical protein [Arachnia sp.]HMT86571.1 hypothetical protein [Arachnia sp.]